MSVSDVLAKFWLTLSGKRNEPKANQNDDIYDSEFIKPTDDEYKDRCVLVGVLRNKHQLDAVLKHKFYHVPVARASGCSFPVKYVAIYQSKKLFGNQSGIKYYGRVASCTTVEREKIREIPKSGKEKYLYFKIKEWLVLDAPIEAKEMEEPVFSTALYLLKNCKNSSELTIRSKEEFLFHKKLTDTVRKMVINRIPDGEDVVYKDFVIKLKGGVLCLYFCDALEYAIGYDIYLENPINVTRDIFDYYPEL